MKILVAKRRAIGDALLTAPALALLKERFPGAEITLLLPAAAAPLFAGHPAVDRLWAWEDKSWWGWWRAIRRERFDYFFDLNCTGRSQWLARLSGAQNIISHRHDPHTASRYPRWPNGVEWDVWCIEETFSELGRHNTKALLPQIYFTAPELEEARALWRAQGVEPGRAVVLGTGASRATKRWPAAYFAAFAQQVAPSHPIAVVVGPGEVEARVVGEITKALAANGTPFVELREPNTRRLAARFATAYAYVGNDSGPKHIAVAAGIPTLTFFGPEDPGEWHPYASPAHAFLFRPGLACRAEDGGRWCGLAECVVEHHKCMAELTPALALKQFQQLNRAEVAEHAPKSAP